MTVKSESRALSFSLPHHYSPCRHFNPPGSSLRDPKIPSHAPDAGSEQRRQLHSTLEATRMRSAVTEGSMLWLEIKLRRAEVSLKKQQQAVRRAEYKAMQQKQDLDRQRAAQR